MNERAQLIAALARYLTTNIGRKTHELIEGHQDAINWALAFKMLHLPFNATAQQAEAALRGVLDAEATYPAMKEKHPVDAWREMKPNDRSGKVLEYKTRSGRWVPSSCHYTPELEAINGFEYRIRVIEEAAL